MSAQPSALVQRIEARFEELGIPKQKLVKRLNLTDAAVSHVFKGRTEMSRRFECAAMDLIDEALIAEQHHAARRERLLNPDSAEAA